MSDSDASESDIPPREECERRCQAFADITGTDTALAMFYLQDREWDLQRSVDAFLQSPAGKSSSLSKNKASTSSGSSSKSGPEADTSEKLTPCDEEQEQLCQTFMSITECNREQALFILQEKKWNIERAVNAFLEGGNSSENTLKGASNATVQEDPKPHRIRLLTWNIDGLDTNNIKTRTTGVCKNILKEDPDVVFLQEVIPITLEAIEKLCPQYHVISSKDKTSFDYFCAMLLKSSSVVYHEHSVIPFYSSKMGRNLLKVQACVKGIDTLLMTSHLESTKHHAAERKNQLKRCFKEMQEAPGNKTVIFGGDLNARDQEIQEAGGVPDGVYDLWEITGKRPEARYTWDLTKNDNLEWNPKFRPKCRFDRIYIRNCKPTAKLKPVYFELAGIQRLEKCQRFCSDHWAILSHYDKL